jgi:hypothetical protein
MKLRAPAKRATMPVRNQGLGRLGRHDRARLAYSAGAALACLLTSGLLSACSSGSSPSTQGNDASMNDSTVPDSSMTGDSNSTKADTSVTPADSGNGDSGDSGSEDSGDSSSDSGDAGDAGDADVGTTTSAIVAPCPVPEAGADAGDAGDAGPTLTITNFTYANDPRVRPTEALFSGVNTLDDPYTQIMRVHNNGASSVTITSVGIAPQATLFPVSFRQTSNPAAFNATVVATSDAGADASTTALALPQTIPAAGDLDIEVQFLSTQTNPPTRYDNTGGDAVAALLVAQSSTACTQAGLYAVALWNDSESVDAGVPTSNYGRYEPTLGQIIATLGYQVNVGILLETFLNVNQVSALAMDPPPNGDTPSDEVIIPTFALADPTKPAVILAPARFAPKFDFPFGWYTPGSIDAGTGQPDGGPEPPTDAAPATQPAGLTWVATMDSLVGSDFYTSDQSEMVLPPISGNTAGTFMPSPATASFGLWCFGNQRTSGSAPLNGDYVYSQDSLNTVNIYPAVDGGSPGNPPLPADIEEAGVNHGLINPVHRYRVWPLKDRAGNLVANSYLIALEEATNDDFQDMIFTISNVKPGN